MSQRQKLFIFIAIIFITIFSFNTVISANTSDNIFEGDGTHNNPYIINDYEDLHNLQKNVNSGENYSGKYFLQTADIDLNNKSWTSIGNSEDNCFSGIYNGNGYNINNLYIKNNKYSGLFGYLKGQVVNLCISSGNIYGDACAAIAYKSVGSNAVIANCINKATLNGKYVGGIAYNFYDGVIANCINLGTLECENPYAITAVNCDVKIYSCYSTNYDLAPSGIVPFESATVSSDYINSVRFSIKYSLTASISKWLFLGNVKIDLLEWQYNGESTYSNSYFITLFIKIVNLYLLPIILLILCIYNFIHYKKAPQQYIQTHKKQIYASLIIFGVISFFIDTALFRKGIAVLNTGNLIFIVLCNIIFITCLICFLKWYKLKFIKLPISLILVIILSVAVELLQFNNVPRYDANIYYGSLIKGTEMFNLDLVSFIGAFTCWKWAQGLCLIIAPFEFLLPRRVIGVYIANILITIVTLCVLYWLLRRIYPSISKLSASLYCLIFAFSPYIIGLFSYLDMDWHIAFFSIWLVAAIYIENDYLISFIGCLLSFTKITGFAFYVFFLSIFSLMHIIKGKGTSLFISIKNWCKPKRVLLWIAPAFMFLLSLTYGNYIVSQSFFGTYVSDSMINLFDINQIANTFLHTFVFGFRWIFAIMMLIGIIIYIIRRKNYHNAEMSYVFSIYLTFILIFILLAVYNADANCPRYTTVFSALYIILLPFLMDMIIQKERIQPVIISILGLLCFIQTFWTIDPSITLYADSIDTGVKKIYKLTYTNDTRPGMNLVSGSDLQYPIIGDVYAYNLEYSYYDNLLEQALSSMDFDSITDIYVLDISLYELNIDGRNYGGGETYKIYWDAKKGKRTFIQTGNRFLNARLIDSDSILNAPKKYLYGGNDFYLLVPSRADSKEVINKLIASGYTLYDYKTIKNVYGSLKLYTFNK